MTPLERAFRKAFPVGLERARELLGLMTAQFYEKASIVDLVAVAYVWGLRDIIEIIQRKERKKMGYRVELTDEQHKAVYELLPRIADLCLAYVISGAPKDSFFDHWAGGMISVADTGSWTDDAMGLAMTETAEKYETMVRKLAPTRVVQGLTTGETQAFAEIRGALLRAGATLIAVNNDLVDAKNVDGTIRLAVEKTALAQATLRDMRIEV